MRENSSFHLIKIKIAIQINGWGAKYKQLVIEG